MNKNAYIVPIAISLALGNWDSNQVARAQIVPDATLPVNSIITPNGNTLTIDGGTQAGGNLFHSFEAFSLPSGEAFFNNGLSVENIITRVTGGNLSNIDGLIRANGVANLFLLNPNGIAFGPNARLNIGGSFMGSTADRFLFEDGRFYSATDTAGSSPLLTVNVPMGLQFGATPGGIQVSGPGHGVRFEDGRLNRDRSPGLQVQPHRTLALVGGDVTLTGGNLTAAGDLGDSTVSGGRIEIGSVAGNNTVTLNSIAKGWQLGYEGVSDFQNIQLSEAASVNTSGAGAGAIQVYGRSLSLQGGSALLAWTLGEEASEDVTIFASESVEAIGSVKIIDISDTVQDFDVQIFESGIIVTVAREASGNGANVTINTDRLVVADGGLISTSTRGGGNGGDLTVNARDVEVRGFAKDPIGNDNPSSLLARVGGDATGHGGNITINTEHLRLSGGGFISTQIQNGEEQGGDVTIRATESVEVRQNLPQPRFRVVSSIRSTVIGQARGNGGNLTIETGRLRVEGGADIATTTLGMGNAGKLTIVAGEIDLVGQGEFINDKGDRTIRPSRLEAQANPRSTGAAGNLLVQAERLFLIDGARISAQTQGFGNDTGNIILNTADLRLRNGSEITALALNNSDGGNITIETDTLTLLDNSRIEADASEGNGGNIHITTQGIFLDFDSTITASSEFGLDGVVTINNPENDPSSGLLELPDTPIDVTALIEEDFCKPGLTSEFVVTGRGGLPPTPLESIGSEAAIQVDLVTLSPELASLVPAEEFREDPVSESPPQRRHRLVEAQGWVIGPNGEVILTAHPPQVTPHGVEPTPSTCGATSNHHVY